MKEKLKKSLKLKKRTIRKLGVRSGLRGGGTNHTTATVVTKPIPGTVVTDVTRLLGHCNEG